MAAPTAEELGSDRGTFARILDDYASLQGFLFILPTFTLLSVILFWPMLQDGLFLSFHEYTISLNEPNPWVGLGHYEYWLTGAGSNLLYFSIKQTILYEFVVVPLDLIVALSVALVLNEDFPGRWFWRGFALTGYASPTVLAGLVFAVMSDARSYGVIYQLFVFIFEDLLGFLGINVPDSGGLTSNTPWAFWAIVFAKVWRDFGFMFIIILAGLQSIPSDLYEIAKVDGAGPIQRFRHITLPHLSTVIVTVVMIRTVFTVGKLEIPYAMTRGGPVNYTSFLAMLMFKASSGFRENLGRTAALGVMFVTVLVPLIAMWIKLETED
ncbi:MAG: carbohydrate ABC transporter permease [Haloferacaceae archaeon]